MDLTDPRFSQLIPSDEADSKPSPQLGSNCAVEGCTNTGKITRGWCGTHYSRWKRHGNPETVLPRGYKAWVNVGPCAVEGCDRQSEKRGWCHNHYRLWRAYGDPTTRKYRKPGKGSQKDRKEWIREYKLKQGCVDCGYRDNPIALQFDHLPGVQKSTEIRNGSHIGWEVLMEEIAKCEVVCANCHHIRTYNRIKQSKEM